MARVLITIIWTHIYKWHLDTKAAADPSTLPNAALLELLVAGTCYSCSFFWFYSDWECLISCSLQATRAQTWCREIGTGSGKWKGTCYLKPEAWGGGRGEREIGIETEREKKQPEWEHIWSEGKRSGTLRVLSRRNKINKIINKMAYLFVYIPGVINISIWPWINSCWFFFRRSLLCVLIQVWFPEILAQTETKALMCR